MIFPTANFAAILPSQQKTPSFFQETRDVLAGKLKAPVDMACVKLLDFMLNEINPLSSGCDATLTHSQLEVRYFGNYGPHDYIPEIAPGVFQQLMLWCQVDSIPQTFHSSLGPVTAEAPHFLDFGERFLWLQHDDQRIDLKIRVVNDPHAIFSEDCPVCHSIVSRILCRPCLACSADWTTNSNS